MPDSPEVMSVDEARERFAGQWLALEVVSRDRDGNPEKVRLIEKASSHVELSQKTRSVRKAYITFAGPLVPDDQCILF